MVGSRNGYGHGYAIRMYMRYLIFCMVRTPDPPSELLEEYSILQKINQWHRRYMDWWPDNPHTWEEFNDPLNEQCVLNWNTTKLLTSVECLDLTITITPYKYIRARISESKLNLFLYISPNSAHPPGLYKCLIFGLLSTYSKNWTLTTSWKRLDSFYDDP